ncbi:hypothetical protein FRB96_002890 [Tulasnella sp. 330]|nr:hypothetical protein FRB96_002890 [Tulasnella sp. 330]
MPLAGVLLFRLLFPQEDHRRRYDLQEMRLVSVLQEALQLTPAATNELKAWGSAQGTGVAIGCLGDAVRRVLKAQFPTNSKSELSLKRIDQLLDELAMHSSFSKLGSSCSATKPRPRPVVVRELYTGLTPFGAACMTQIILKDLRPLLYPIVSTRSTINLMRFKRNAIHQLTHYEAMAMWDYRMPGIYRSRASLDEAAKVVDRLRNETITVDPFTPTLGVPVEIPKCIKGQDCQSIIDAMRGHGGPDTLWAETKYDGERSSRKVNETLHWIVLPVIPSLGLPTLHDDDPRLDSRTRVSAHPARRVGTSVILEAEMVCYNEGKACIDEFWRIRSLVEATAQGGRARFNGSNFQAPTEPGTLDDVHESLLSTGEDSGNRHFMLVFFDVLLLDGKNLTRESYGSRRALLKQLICPITGYAMLAKREKLCLRDPDAKVKLNQVFARHITDYEEGLVLKPGSSTYNDLRPSQRWVKLKKDYIKGLGDTLDLAVFGASWDRDRGRELRVGPETYTTFFIGAMNRSVEKKRKARDKIHIKILFAASYGLSREQLDDFNWEIKQSKTYVYAPMKLGDLPYTLELAKGMPRRPTVIFSQPRLVELMGAGFTKSAGSDHYELRFPRITKIWRHSERSWLDGKLFPSVDIEELHKVACDSIGRDAPDKTNADAIKAIWGLPVSPGVRAVSRRSSRMSSWLEKLNAVDEQRGRRGQGEKRSATQEPVSPTKRPRLSGPDERIFRSSTNFTQSPDLTRYFSPVSAKQPALTPSPLRPRRSNTENRPLLTPGRGSRQGFSTPPPPSAGHATQYLVYPSPPQNLPPLFIAESLPQRWLSTMAAGSIDTSHQQTVFVMTEERNRPQLDLLPPFSLDTEELSNRGERGVHKRKKAILRNRCVRKTECSLPSLPELLALAERGGLQFPSKTFSIPELVPLGGRLAEA